MLALACWMAVGVTMTVSAGAAPPRAARGSAAVSAALSSATLIVPAPTAAVWDTLQGLESRFRWAASESLAHVIVGRFAQAPAPDSMEYARALIAIGTSRLKRNLYVDGQGYEALERGIAIRARRAPAGDRVLAAAHVTAAVLYTDGGRVDEACAHGEEALRVLGASSPPDTLLMAQCEMALGVAQSRLGHVTAARAAFEKALLLRETRLGRDAPTLVPTLAQYGEFLVRVGEFDAARALLMRAVRNSARDTASMSDYLEGSIARLSTLERRIGNLAESIELAQRAFELTRRRVGDDARETAMRRIVLAYRLEDLGDHPAAAALLEPALAVMDAKVGPANPQSINARLVLVDNLIVVGDTARAARELAIVGPALARQEALANENEALFRSSEARLEVARGHVAAARETLDLAIRHETRRGDRVGTDLASLLGQALETTRGPEDRGYAEGLGAAVARLRDSTRVRSTPEWIDLLGAQAAADARLGLHEPAWDLALEAEQRARARLGFALQALPDRRALQLALRLGAPCDLLVELARPDHESELATAWDRIVRWRGLVGHEIARRRLPAGAGTDTALAAAHGRWLSAQRRLAQLVVSGSAHPDDPASAERFEAARHDAEEAERRYVRLASGSVSADDSVSLRRVLERLGPDQALIAFASAGTGAEAPRLGAFVASGRDQRVRFVSLGASSEIEAGIREWTRRLAVPPRDPTEARREEQACRLLGASVRASVWDPIARELGATREALLVPEGPVFELPWLALPERGGRYLADDPLVIRVLNAERDLLPSATAPATSGLLAVGGPDFDVAGEPATAPPPVAMLLRARSWPCSGEPVALPPLPAARAEAEDIARRWPANGGRPELLVGAAADEATFKRDAPGQRVIHLATHGVVFEDTCRARVGAGTRGMGGVEDLAPARSTRRAARVPAPGAEVTARPASTWLGRQVWLALAGANRPPSETRDENEGLLTAEEITTLDLRGTDWVVLSACQSGVAPVWAHEGVLGMRRAFQLAGARAVIASQWPVADQATHEWMSALYDARAAGLQASAAVRAASRAMLAARRRDGRVTNPFYWAAFTATGE